MRLDVLVIGAELDGGIAAIRLAELGHSVGVVTAGAGSLHYAPGAIRLLGYLDGDRRQPVQAPFASLAQIDRRHPYALAGTSRVAAALEWFTARPTAAAFDTSADMTANRMSVTPAGLAQPVLLPAHAQATFEQIAGRAVAVLQFDGHLDFPAGLLLAALEHSGIRASRISTPPPADRVDNLGLACAFDRLPDVEAFFRRMRPLLQHDAELVLAPAVLGLHRHRAIMDAAAAGLGMAIFEVPTLPPSIPGMRWQATLDRLISDKGCILRKGVRIAGAEKDGDRIRSVRDENGRTIEAGAYILATGGVLMGGLAVDADGRVSETIFGIKTVQTAPLNAGSAEATLAALHGAGIEVDDCLRPCDSHRQGCENVFVTGRTLAHWHPARELSAEGVSIVTGWVAAEAAHAELEG